MMATGQARAQAPQQWPAPYQREGATVKLSEHVYVIPDFKVGMVPNVGIVVGTKGALVSDPGMGWRNGEVAFPASAKAPQSRSDTWLMSLDEMEHLKPRAVVGAHYYDIGDASDIEASRGYLKALRARAAELKKHGKSADEAGKILVDEFKAKYPSWAQPARVQAGVAAVYRELP